MSIQSESFSDLLNKYTLITVELTRLNALMVYYSDIGHEAKFAATVNAIKRLEMSKSAIAIELDKRIPNVTSAPRLDLLREEDSDDEVRPPA